MRGLKIVIKAEVKKFWFFSSKLTKHVYLSIIRAIKNPVILCRLPFQAVILSDFISSELQYCQDMLVLISLESMLYNGLGHKATQGDNFHIILRPYFGL